MKSVSVFLIVVGMLFLGIAFRSSYAINRVKGEHEGINRNGLTSTSPIIASTLLPAGLVLLYVTYRRKEMQENNKGAIHF